MARTNKPATNTENKAARSAKRGQRVTRSTTLSRHEIRRETVHRKGHTK